MKKRIYFLEALHPDMSFIFARNTPVAELPGAGVIGFSNILIVNWRGSSRQMYRQ